MPNQLLPSFVHHWRLKSVYTCPLSCFHVDVYLRSMGRIWRKGKERKAFHSTFEAREQRTSNILTPLRTSVYRPFSFATRPVPCLFSWPVIDEIWAKYEWRDGLGGKDLHSSTSPPRECIVIENIIIRRCFLVKSFPCRIGIGIGMWPNGKWEM